VPDHNDELLNRAIDELRTLPPIDRAAVSRIVGAASRARELGPAEDDGLLAPRRERGWVFRFPAVASIAAAAAIIGFVAGTFETRGPSVPPSAGVQAVLSPNAPETVAATRKGASSQAQVTAVSANPSPLAPIATRFEIESSQAERVSLVGDFNSWDDRTTPLERVPGTSRWATTVRLIPGRHVYAFMVDGKLEVDPQAPQAKDRELGVTTSVVIVGKP